jgi:hypothetical protein
MNLAWPSLGIGARRSVAAVLMGAVILAAPAARAQTPSKDDLDRARALFREGVAAQAAENWALALQKYNQVIKVKLTAQVAFNIAECESKLGKLTEALGNYRIAQTQAEGEKDKSAQTVAQQVGSRIEDLDARIPKLTVKRGKGADAATIELDGTELGPAQIGAVMSVDPGPHVVVGHIGPKEYVRETVTLVEKDNKTFVVKIDLPAPVAVVTPPVDTEPPPPPPPQKSKVPGIVLTAGGGVLLVTGLAMFGPRQSAISQLQKDCHTDGHCPTNDASVASSGKLYTGLTEVFVPVGTAAAVVGIVLLVKSAPPKDKSSDDKKESEDKEKKDAFWRSLDVAAWAPGADVGGLSVRGKF